MLELLLELRKTLGLTYIFITHDLSVVRNISDRVVVLYRGRIVETGDTPDVFARTRHRYTQMLLSSIPVISDDEAAYKPEWRWDRDMAASEKVDEAGCCLCAALSLMRKRTVESGIPPSAWLHLVTGTPVSIPG